MWGFLNYDDLTKYGDQIGYALALVFVALSVVVHAVYPTAISVEFVMLILAIAVPAWFSGFRSGLAGLFGTIIGVLIMFGWPLAHTDYEDLGLFYAVALIVFLGFSTMGRNMRLMLARAVRSEQLIDLASDALLVRDLSLSGVIRFWSAGAQRMYGYTSIEAIGRSVQELLRSEYPLPEDQLIALAIKEGAWDGELVQSRKDGTRLTVHSRWRVEPGHRPRFAREVNGPSVLETNRDITTEKVLERERRLRIQAESNVKARDDFLAIAAHELKTPLTSLLGFSQMSQRELTIAQPDRVRVARAVDAVAAQAQRLTRLTDQLLDVSRIAGGKANIKPEHGDLVRLAHGGITRARGRWPGREFHYQGSENPVFAMVDPNRIDQVLANLLENACKFSEGRVEVSVDPVGPNAQIYVRDYGRGVPEELRESIFERAVQVDPRNANSGLGLGLFICREIIHLHGGTICVQSPPDNKPGSRFIIELPMTADG